LTLIQARYSDTRDSIPDLVRFVAEQSQKKASRLGDVLVIYDLDIGFWAHAAELDAALSTGAFAKQPSCFRHRWSHRVGQFARAASRRYHAEIPAQSHAR